MNPSSHSLWYRQSAKNFNEALPLGNGRMGAMVYGGGAEGVKVYVEKLRSELADAMAMCGAHSLAEISRDMVYGY